MAASSKNPRIRADEALLRALAGEHLDDFEATMGRSDGAAVKKGLTERQVHRLTLNDGSDYFLKRVFIVPLLEALKRRLGGGEPSRPGHEWRALRRLRELGVPAAQPVLCAEAFRMGLVRRAFILTRGLPVLGSLEQLLLGDPDPGINVDAIARQVAGHLGRMHRGGVNHRDFYLGHLFLGVDRETVYIMDLDRADCRREVSRRWRVKDLAALHFSTPPRLATPFRRLLFLRRYLGKPLAGDRALLGEIEEKAQAMRTHVERKLARGQANYHVNE